MENQRILPDKKKAKRLNAHIVMPDESGFMMEPLVRRTLAPRGETPILKCGDYHQKVSGISAITISPKRKKIDLCFKLLPDNKNVKGPDIVNFLRDLKIHIPGPICMIWDKGPIHCCKVVKAYLAKHSEIKIFNFPSYSPDSNPDEQVWKHSKCGDLANNSPPNLTMLRFFIERELYEIKNSSKLLRAFISHAGLQL